MLKNLLITLGLKKPTPTVAESRRNTAPPVAQPAADSGGAVLHSQINSSYDSDCGSSGSDGGSCGGAD